MQKVIKLWFAFTLSAGLLASCSQDGREPSSATDGGGEIVTLSLSAEVSVEDPSLRAINYKLGKNSKDQLVPMPQFVDKQEVEVHTIIKSSSGVRAAKTLKWKYDATKRKLVLSPTNQDISLDANNMVISGFNNDNSVKWYISGLIGGELVPGTTRVTFAGERVLKGVVGNEGDIVGSLNVPYSFGWTELSINTTGTRDSNGSYKYAEIPTSANVKFVPRGSLIAYKLGNAQSGYSFTAQGFSVGSNAWGDQGEFELNTNIPSSEPHKQLPAWKESSCGSSMYYTFATGHAPSTISANGTADKIYYAWVMSHSTQPASTEVRVMLKGESSRQATATYRDYTKTWFTDYSPKSTGTQGKVTQGLVHSLTAKATHRLVIPIEYVTDYNLAGGEGLTYTTTNYTSPQPVGVRGPLRFSNYDDSGAELPAADRHKNDASGYYNWYKVFGRHDATYNPNTRNLQTAVDDTFGAGKYFIPTADQWWGIFPTAKELLDQNWYSSSASLNTEELMRVGLGVDVLRQAYSSDYSAVFTFPHGGSDDTSDVVFYAIRFKARANVCAPVSEAWDYDATTNSYKSYTYASALDNSMKCAYRFTRVGGKTSWNQSVNNQNLTNHLRIDVVYLGEQAGPTSLSTISDESWWSEKASRDEVITKVFPATGEIAYTSPSLAPGSLYVRGHSNHYWSSSQKDASSTWSTYVSGGHVYVIYTWFPQNGYPVRLFVRRNQ